ncbi:hypothetical protein KJ877_00155 [bacterium]|nr:hypothetical protein [bacterium]MBU1990323.1 hypothetical protein [bacterium]
MKLKTSLVASTLVLGLTFAMLGCSGSSSSDSTTDTPTPSLSTSYTSVSGTTGSTDTTSTLGTLFSSSVTPAETIEGTATLIVDTSNDGLFGSDDAKYSTPVINGSFSFDEVSVLESGATKAQLTVVKEGFAPYVRTISLTQDNPLTVLAEIGKKPVLTEVIKLPDANTTARLSSFVKFGVTKSSTGISSFSKLMSLSEFKAEADLNLTQEGALSESVIPTGSFPSDVTSVTANLQAFDSTDAEDFEYFPGSLSGHGKPAVGASATTDTTELPLESAGFDMISLTDQNGEHIDLQPVAASKLLSMGVFDGCTGMQWTRYITSAQADVIKAWGDDDNTTAGFQVPIWSNDNSTGTWAYIGLADAFDLNGSNPYFQVCVDSNWQGYLNCDSTISIEQPKQLCIAAVDQDGNPIGGVSVYGRLGTGGNYANTYLNATTGKGVLGLTTGVPSDWTLTYSGSITGWSSAGIDSSLAVVSTTTGCDYDLNITIDNPYSAEIRVRAYAMNDDTNSTPLANARVGLSSSNYADYYSRSAYTNVNGEAVFAVKPNVAYVASYKAGTSNVNVNSAVVAPETADSGVYASVEVKDANVAPSVYIYTNRSQLTDQAETLGFTISASDRNGDTLTLSSLKLNGTTLVKDVDYSVKSSYSYAGSLYIQGVLDLNASTVSAIAPTSLSVGSYSLSAAVTDSKTPTTQSVSFSVNANQAPVIGSIYLVDPTGRYYYVSGSIPVGDYTVVVYAYDPDGDVVTKTMAIDGSDVTGVATSLAQGDHNITVTATDSNSLSSTKTVKVFVGNHKPVIRSAGASKYKVDITVPETFKLYAYVSDAENDPLTVKAKDANGTVYDLTRLYSYDTKYVSAAITLTEAKAANVFTIVANDADNNSTAVTVSVESFATNKAPIFTTELTAMTVNINEAQNFSCVAEDPEGTYVTYEWSLNGVVQSDTDTTFAHTFTSTGSNTLSCKATDGDGKYSTSNASIFVIDPTVSGVLTVHTGLQGLIVSKHSVTNYALMDEKVTDANGDVTFNVVGDRTTFAVSAWPGMEVSAAFIMDMLKTDLEWQALYNCMDSNVTECATADWCALSQTDTIENWIWDITRDVNDTRPLASSVDVLPADGVISETELYTGALYLLDANDDNKLTWSEINGEDKDVHMEVFANVPVREYYINFSPMGMDQKYQIEYESEMCMDSFDANITITGLTPETSHELQSSGSAYAYGYGVYADANGTISVPIYVNRPGADAKYTILFKGKETAQTEWNYYLLKSKTEAEIKAGITLSADSFGTADTNVTITNSATERLTNIDVYSNGLWVGASNITTIDYNASGEFSVFTDSSFTYSLDGYESLNVDGTYVNKNHYKYYTIDPLTTSAYSAVDYPHLAVDLTFDLKGNWQLSGDEMSEVNVVSFGYNKYAYVDASMNLNININWTVAPSSMPDINITAVAPTAIVADITAIEAASGDTSVYLDVEDFKGITDETSFLNAAAGSTQQNIGELGYRYVGFEKWLYDAYATAYSADVNTRTTKRASVFSIGYDTDKLFAK